MEIDYSEVARGLAVERSGDGEVSLSVAETNKLRARLGLKPLNASESSSASSARLQAERNFELAQSSRREARRLGEIEAELARAKRRRESRAKLASLDVTSDAFLAEAKRLEAERRAALLQEQDYGADDLEGVQVSASAADLKRGESRVLTLMDDEVLAREAHGRVVGLNEAEDVLENVDAAERAKRARDLATRRREAAAAGTDDAEFLDAATEATRLTLGKKGFLNDPVPSLDRADLLPAEGESLVVGASFQSEYMTAEEARRLFKKPRRAKAARKKLTGLDEPDASSEDRGSRGAVLERRARQRAEDEARDRDARLASYAFAQQKQQALVDKTLAEEQAPPRFVDGLGDEEDDAELRASLARARLLNKTRQERPDPAAAVLDRPAVDEPAALAAEPGLVFTDTTEFTSRLHARLEERAAEVLAQQRDTSAEGDAAEEQEGDEEDDEADRIDFLHNQPLAAEGMAATMSLLQTSGDLEATVPEIVVGRARDERFDEARDQAAPHDVTFKGQLKPIKLEYRDADGHLLTRREAYRRMCWKFHGKTPGVKKQEKAAARLKETQRSIKQSNTSGSLAILQHAQQRTGQAFIPINNSTDMANNLLGLAPNDAKSKKKPHRRNHHKPSSSSAPSKRRAAA